jgi:hypothetical protein
MLSAASHNQWLKQMQLTCMHLHPAWPTILYNGGDDPGQDVYYLKT